MYESINDLKLGDDLSLSVMNSKLSKPLKVSTIVLGHVNLKISEFDTWVELIMFFTLVGVVVE